MSQSWPTPGEHGDIPVRAGHQGCGGQSCAGDGASDMVRAGDRQAGVRSVQRLSLEACPPRAPTLPLPLPLTVSVFRPMFCAL